MKMILLSRGAGGQEDMPMHYLLGNIAGHRGVALLALALVLPVLIGK